MSDSNKWNEMVSDSRAAIEDFADFSDDIAIVYAADRIEEMKDLLAKSEKFYGSQARRQQATIDKLIDVLRDALDNWESDDTYNVGEKTRSIIADIADKYDQRIKESDDDKI